MNKEKNFMDIKEFKKTFINALEEDCEFRHTVLNILADDISKMASINTTTDWETNFLTQVSLEINSIHENETISCIRNEKSNILKNSFLDFFNLFKSKNIIKKSQCEKMYYSILYSTCENKNIDEFKESISLFLNKTKEFINNNPSTKTYDYLISCFDKNNISLK